MCCERGSIHTYMQRLCFNPGNCFLWIVQNTLARTGETYGCCTCARLGVFCRSPFDGRPQGGGHLEPPARDSSGGCPGFIYPLGPGTLKMSARVTAQARSTLAAAPAPAVCTLGVVRPRNECGILLRKVQLVRHTSQSRNRAKSADTHTNNRRGYE